ncbi:MAG: sugar ABC transporter permease [Clostridia bacterium]|jgi:arabinogalactan oligomer/maltooligosaccharide transport system permease protein|nr:sugar ABC transporter permease [Clostridia bacterium]
MENKRYRSKKLWEKTSLALIYAVLIIISLIWLVPFFMLIILSFRGEHVGMSADYLFPKQWSFDNYIKLFTETKFLTWYGNTMLVSVVVTVFQTVIVLMTSYALSRLRFKMRKPLMNLMLILGMFPGFLSMTAVYFVLKEINLTQNLLGLMLVYTASSAMQYYICKGFFDTIPKSLDEAARIDGASRHTIFVKIILPLAKPIIIYTILTAFIAPWGEYMFSSFIMLGDPDKFTVAVGMKSWLDNSTMASEYFTVFCAAAVVVSIPITALFIWLQRYYVEGITGGSVKG